MRFASLGSGSSGNALVVEVGTTRVLLDCGFGLADTERRLARLGLAARELDAIIVTHEHDDHAAGVVRLARSQDLPIYLTYGTLAALGPDRAGLAEVNVIDAHAPFAVGNIEVRPFPVPHDAKEPAQFVFGDGAVSLGVLTDTGSSTPHILAMLSGLHALVVECNHDLNLLENGPYPESVKRRIAGRFGHLDNETAADIVAGLDCSRLKHLVAAHLSRQNNAPELAQAAIARALNCEPGWIAVASQDEGFGWREI